MYNVLLVTTKYKSFAGMQLCINYIHACVVSKCLQRVYKNRTYSALKNYLLYMVYYRYYNTCRKRPRETGQLY
jgi:hypothetical protein